LLDLDTVRAVLHFCLFCPREHLSLFVEFSWWLPRSLLLPGKISLQLSGLPLLLFSHKTSHSDNAQTVAAAATSQVKLCLYDEKEQAIWFRLIVAQFAAVGIKSQKQRYINALASLPKQVLWDILDTVDVCNESDQSFDLLKEVLLGQLVKSKWQSYFELLLLPMEMQGLKPSVLMGKLKQHLPHSVSSDNDLFLAMFLICLPLSMQEAMGAGNHKTAMAMVRAADALWDARGGHDSAQQKSSSC
jgi:hypothetical protein